MTNSNYLRDNGEIVYIYTVLIDITENKKLERKLHSEVVFEG